MKTPRKMLSFCALGLLVAWPVHSQTTDWLQTKASRLKQAKEWLDEFEALDAQIPTLSPREKEWLNTEIPGGHITNRALSAMESREYQISVAKPSIAFIVYNLNMILINSMYSCPHDKEEAKYWLRVAIEFMDYELWQALDTLQKQKIIEMKTIFKGPPESSDSYVFYLNWVTQSHWILSAIVNEYMTTDSLSQ